jgi:hypothetical protein
MRSGAKGRLGSGQVISNQFGRRRNDSCLVTDLLVTDYFCATPGQVLTCRLCRFLSLYSH